LVKRGESEEVEFKKSTAQLDRALKSVCSFFNYKGGRVYLAINSNKQMREFCYLVSIPKNSSQDVISVLQDILEKI